MKSVSVLLPYYNRKEYLEVSLDSFTHFYSGQDIEFIIVDDGSDPRHQLNGVVDQYDKINIKLIRLDNKIGANPSRPYNVAARHAKGEILILSSPETIHTKSILNEANLFDGMSYNDYLCFSVFCPTQPAVTSRLLAKETFDQKLSYIDSIRNSFHTEVGSPPLASFANQHGSWYLHSTHRPSHLNFLTAICARKYNDLCGFDERFVGTGYDDNEFLDRVLPNALIKYYDGFEAIHVNHPPVYGTGNPISNQQMYSSIKTGMIGKWTDKGWGL